MSIEIKSYTETIDSKCAAFLSHQKDRGIDYSLCLARREHFCLRTGLVRLNKII
jgi:hypothetical protein